MSDSETINASDELIPENSVSEPVSPIDKILDYVTETPGNTNRAVLGSMLQSLVNSSTPKPEKTLDVTPSNNAEESGPVMTGIEIIEEPTKTAYSEGDTLDLTGLRVIGHWTGDITDELDYSEYVATPANGTTLTNDITEVIISVGTFEDSFAITVNANNTSDIETV